MWRARDPSERGSFHLRARPLLFSKQAVARAGGARRTGAQKCPQKRVLNHGEGKYETPTSCVSFSPMSFRQCSSHRELARPLTWCSERPNRICHQQNPLVWTDETMCARLVSRVLEIAGRTTRKSWDAGEKILGYVRKVIFSRISYQLGGMSFDPS